MQMGHVRLRAAGAKLQTYTIRDNSKPLVARYAIARVHLDITKELVFRCPTVAMIDLHMTKGLRNYSPRCRGSNPKTRGVLPFPHIVVGCKVDRAANTEIVRTTQGSPRTIIEPINGNPGNS